MFFNICHKAQFTATLSSSDRFIARTDFGAKNEARGVLSGCK